MCCILCCFKPKCVKILLFVISILLLGCCAVAIYTAVQLKSNAIIGIIGGIIGQDIRTYIFYVVIVLGAIIIFLMLWICYGISFSDISALSTYLDYFGEIESSYSCSGFCSALPVFYFSDSYTSLPTKACKDSIKNDLLDGEMKFYGIGFTIIGSIMFLIWFVQYGLCCRRKDNSGQGTKRF